jgi:hypothetical protein
MAKMKEIYMEILEQYGYDVEVTSEMVREFLKEQQDKNS